MCNKLFSRRINYLLQQFDIKFLISRSYGNIKIYRQNVHFFISIKSPNFDENRKNYQYLFFVLLF